MAVGAANIDSATGKLILLIDRIVERNEFRQPIGVLRRRQIASAVIVRPATMANDIKEIAPHRHPHASTKSFATLASAFYNWAKPVRKNGDIAFCAAVPGGLLLTS